MKRLLILGVLWLLPLVRCHAQESQRLEEKLAPGMLHQVSCRVEITGQLLLPADKDNPSGKSLAVKGSSAIDYDERILAEKQGKIDRTIRNYRKLNFDRKVGDQAQESTLRPDTRLQVIMRHNQFEVPFSPRGPLTWSEIDLVRTDVFTPALLGLLPTGAVTPGDKWQADKAALQELTDLDQVQEGVMTCKFDSIATLVKRQLARVSFQANVKGIGEDGPTRHELEGYLFFDLESRHLSYLYVKGTQFLLDKAGKSSGKIDGSFVLTREPLKSSNELSDDALRGLVLEPNDENTQLLYDNPEVGIRFLHPRAGHVAGVSGKQIALDEKKGSGLLITLEPLTKLPTGGQFQKETLLWLSQQKSAPVHRTETLRVEQGGPDQIDRFAFETDLNKQRVVMDYYVLRQAQGGATVAARLLANDAQALQRDVGRIVRSVRIAKQ